MGVVARTSVREAIANRNGGRLAAVSNGLSEERNDMGREIKRVPLERSEPPEGEGWQLWETVSEGSPVSPVFESAEQLADWMSHPDRETRWVPKPTAMAFIEAGWAPTFVSTAATGLVSGVEATGMRNEK